MALSSSREDRGLEIAKSNVISENADGSFSVPSQSSPEVCYRVVPLDGSYLCNCPDFKNRAEEVKACKHVHAVKFWLAAKVELRDEPKPKVFSEDAAQCPKCGSIRVIQYGTKRGRQAYLCKDCEHRFVESSLIKGSRYSPEMVSLTLDLYFSGTSLRKTARILNNHFGTKMGKSSVARWIDTLVPKVSAYVDSLTPELSGTWQADELFVKMKGGEDEKQYGQKRMAYLWNVMDRGTRFLLASKVSKNRNDDAAVKAMLEAKHNAHDSQPETIITDGHRSYKEGISYAWFHDPKPTHIAKASIKKPNATTTAPNAPMHRPHAT